MTRKTYFLFNGTVRKAENEDLRLAPGRCQIPATLIGQKKKSVYIYFSVISALSIVTAGALYAAYGDLRQYYFPIGLAVLAAAGLLVYILLTRVVDL